MCTRREVITADASPRTADSGLPPHCRRPSLWAAFFASQGQTVSTALPSKVLRGRSEDEWDAAISRLQSRSARRHPSVAQGNRPIRRVLTDGNSPASATNFRSSLVRVVDHACASRSGNAPAGVSLTDATNSDERAVLTTVATNFGISGNESAGNPICTHASLLRSQE